MLNDILGKNKVQHFWNWFISNQDELFLIKVDPDKYLQVILDQLSKIEKGLSLEIENTTDANIQLTFSADGVIELFPAIEKIVASAPTIEHWNFIAFRQRLAPKKISELGIKAKGVSLNANNLFFKPYKNGNDIHLLIFVPGLTDTNFNDVAYAALLLIDNILGEYDCVTQVKSYDFEAHNITASPAKNVFSLTRLAEFIDSQKNN